MGNEELKQHIIDLGYSEDTVVFENPDYADAFIGVSNDGRAAYAFDRMVECLMNEGMDYEEAVEFIDYNTLRALDYAGDRAPIILYSDGGSLGWD